MLISSYLPLDTKKRLSAQYKQHTLPPHGSTKPFPVCSHICSHSAANIRMNVFQAKVLSVPPCLTDLEKLKGFV